LPSTWLTRRKLGHELLHLYLSNIQIGDSLTIGLHLLHHGLNLLLKLGSLGVPPSGTSASGNIHLQPELHHMLKSLKSRSCAGGALVATICYRRIIMPLKLNDHQSWHILWSWLGEGMSWGKSPPGGPWHAMPMQFLIRIILLLSDHCQQPISQQWVQWASLET